MVPTPSDPRSKHVSAGSGDPRTEGPADPGGRHQQAATESALDGFPSESPEIPEIPQQPAVPGVGAWPRERPSSPPLFAAPDEVPEIAEVAEPSPAPVQPSLNRSRVGEVLLKRLEERRVRVAALCGAAALGLMVPFCGGWFSGPASDGASGVSTSAAAAAVGTITLESTPSGAMVVIDGKERGKTPLQVSLAPGDHPVEISSGAARRQLTAAVAAGGAASFYVELSGGAELGGLEIMSDPPGAQVSLDGVSRGVTPLVLSGLPPGEHDVRLSREGRTINRAVRVTAGGTASVVLSLAASDAAGWVSFKAPFEMKVLEKGTVLGTTASERIMLPAGAHTFDLVSEALDFTTTLPVRIAAGRTVTATVPVPTGLLSVNALPWAEVLIDGESVGTTPLGNLAVPIGSREVVWRHPQFGERRQRVEVKAGAPVRIGVDFTQ